MIVLIQRVKRAQVLIKEKLFAQINNGYVILLGIFDKDDEKDIFNLTEKVANLRIMSDEKGKMNKSILETKGEILLVSQFTLCADTEGGRRPSFIKAKPAKEAKILYQLFVQKLKEKNIPVKTGEFGEYMEVQIFNDGPVTIIINSKKI